ncbi:hypothetical protein Pth03_17950 [Planotetraspora thailandica]|uniref:Uncharacterized protein n=1 Tax=Planotetraspora thailandica TaxID=487172 RepID=A0A8J3XV74_9ACTN|nr:hypothetical protein Pth03_17950 [Planotetraspora thailandica]
MNNGTAISIFAIAFEYKLRTICVMTYSDIRSWALENSADLAEAVREGAPRSGDPPNRRAMRTTTAAHAQPPTRTPAHAQSPTAAAAQTQAISRTPDRPRRTSARRLLNDEPLHRRARQVTVHSAKRIKISWSEH